MRRGARHCPNCGPSGILTAVDSRKYLTKEGVLTQRRRRRCHKCGDIFATIEVDAEWFESVKGAGQKYSHHTRRF